MKHLAIVVSLLAIVSCNNLLARLLGSPFVGTSVERTNDGYVFAFRNCTRPGVPIEIEEITVIPNVPVEEAEKVEPFCHIEMDLRSSSGKPIDTTWRYGEAPEGYNRVRCEPLVPGKDYQIRLGGLGYMKFTIRPDGSVGETTPMCSQTL